MSRERTAFLSGLSYIPDPFQIAAMDSIDSDASVLVSAPTGSGKTLIAEYAITRSRSMGKRAFYTAPIKALSNQKHRDLASLYGAESVGIVTGDNAINPDAPVVVMTTEVLRNMIYSGSSRLDDLGVVVLDEVHYLQDAYRGPVWEEVIIQLDPAVQLVCLSATVSNASEVGEWLTTVRGRTDVVVESTRPVELLNHYSFRDKATGETVMHDTVVGGQPNERLRRLLAGSQPSVDRRSPRTRGPRGGRFTTPGRPDIVRLLEDNDMLPAIVFIFSRAQCEDAVAACVRDGLVMTTMEEEMRISEIVEAHCATLSDDDRVALGFDDFLDDVGTGVACHHAGMIPMFKEAVEECFVEGLVKVVFATETLAVGINMPARAVVIEKLTKYTGEHHALLRASEFTQLTGRAGRRGLDEIGHAITLWNPFVTYDQAVGLALSRSFRLSSAFRPTFNMAVNMVRSHSREGVMHLLNLSFAQFQADRDVVTTEAALDKRRRELVSTMAALGRIEEQPTSEPAQEGEFASQVEAEIALRALRPGDVVMFDASNLRGRGLVLSTASRRSGIRVSVLTPSRKIVEITAKDLGSIPRRGARVDLPVPFEPARTDFIREACARLVRARLDESVGLPVQGGGTGPRSETPLSASHVKRLRREIEQMEERARNRSGSVGARFMDVVDLLGDLGYIDEWSLTDKGSTLSGIFHESDLLVVEVLARGVLDRLAVPDLVGVLSCLVYEPRGGMVGAATRWPSDQARQRFKRMEKISLHLQALQRDRGLVVHRAPHGGISWECSQWAQGRALSTILDPDLTPGDFVRTIRQIVDLLRQIGVAAPAELAQTCVAAEKAIDRGVVAAASEASA